jgi:hypothetical protein
VSTFEIIVVVLLSILCFLSWISLMVKNNIANTIEGLQTSVQINNSDNYNLTSEFRSEVRLAIDELCDLNRDSKEKIDNISLILDIFYKYKLPDKSERDLCDKIAIENEISDGISIFREKNTS